MSQFGLMNALEEMFSVPRAVPVSRAALGLFAVLKGWRGKQEICRVALPAAICHEVVVAVIAAGCDPIFCDVSPSDGLVVDSEWRRARELGATVAIVVHLYGNPASLQAVRELFPNPKCLVVDDAAQALGSRNAEGLCGGGGDVGLLSFGATKHIAVGNAALLFRDERLAASVEALLKTIEPAPAGVRAELASSFRTQLEQARARLRMEGNAAAGAFSGLLNGLEPLLRVPALPDADDRVLRAIEAYPTEIQARVAKSNAWSASLTGCGLAEVGMKAGCVPWRFVCRWPGADWSSQAGLSESLRSSGMHVSNWYLPAHWMLGYAPGLLTGVEQLAREVLEFWVDASVSSDSIVRDARIVRREMARLDGRGTGG